MLRSKIGLVVGSIVFALTLTMSCAVPEDVKVSDEGSATVVLALTTVPSDVQCLEVTVTASATTTQLFPLTAGQPATITLPGLPSGPVSIDERAFAVPCDQVQSTTPPTWVSTMPAMTTLVAGQIADVTIVLRRAGQVRVTTDFQDGAQFTVSPSSVDFGSVPVGAAGGFELTVTNTGTAAGVPALSIGGANATEFALTTNNSETNPCLPTTSVVPGASCHIFARFFPATSGTKTGTVLNGGVAAVALTGTVPGATFTINTSSIDFGPLPLNATASQELTVTNSGGAPAIPMLSVTGPSVPEFSVRSQSNETNPCSSTTPVAPGASCHAFAIFSPATLGAKSATIVIAGSSAVVTLAASVFNVPGSFSISPSSANFGNVAVMAVATSPITITNNGTTTAAVPVLLVVGPNATEFSVQAAATQTNPCTANLSLAPGASCNTSARFAPTSAGAKIATIIIGQALGVTLSGTGT
jgi:hypothetical protein